MEQPPDPAPAPKAPEPTAQGSVKPSPKAHEIGRRTYLIADVDPLDVDGVRTVAVGTVLWLVAFVMLLPFSGRLAETGRIWWLWTCLAGFGLGILGWDHCRRRRRRRRQQVADRAGTDQVGFEPPV